MLWSQWFLLERLFNFEVNKSLRSFIIRLNLESFLISKHLLVELVDQAKFPSSKVIKLLLAQRFTALGLPLDEDFLLGNAWLIEKLSLSIRNGLSEWTPTVSDWLGSEGIGDLRARRHAHEEWHVGLPDNKGKLPLVHGLLVLDLFELHVSTIREVISFLASNVSKVTTQDCVALDTPWNDSTQSHSWCPPNLLVLLERHWMGECLNLLGHLLFGHLSHSSRLSWNHFLR